MPALMPAVDSSPDHGPGRERSGEARPDSFASRLLEAQAQQHKERMEEARDLRKAIAGRLDKIDAEVAAVSRDVAEVKNRLPGKWLQAAGLAFGGTLLILLILLLATSRGIDVAPAVAGTKALVPAEGGAHSE